MSFLGGSTLDTANGITSLGPTEICPMSENNSKHSLKEKNRSNLMNYNKEFHGLIKRGKQPHNYNLHKRTQITH